jgi:nicotinamidase-related amidase
MCVSSTARAALDLGYRVTIPHDACATRALPDPVTGAAIPGAEIHRHALAELADRFAVVVPASALA